MTTENIPIGALKIHFTYGDKKGYFHVWPTKTPITTSVFPNACNTKWQWSAWGNGGEENTQEEAIQAARNWINRDIQVDDKKRRSK